MTAGRHRQEGFARGSGALSNWPPRMPWLLLGTLLRTYRYSLPLTCRARRTPTSSALLLTTAAVVGLPSPSPARGNCRPRQHHCCYTAGAIRNWCRAAKPRRARASWPGGGLRERLTSRVDQTRASRPTSGPGGHRLQHPQEHAVAVRCSVERARWVADKAGGQIDLTFRKTPSGRRMYGESAFDSWRVKCEFSSKRSTNLYGCEPACVSGVPFSFRKLIRRSMPKPTPCVASIPLACPAPLALVAIRRKW